MKAWGEVTKYYLDHFDSRGSRLHRGNDGIWYAYAQWKSQEQRKNASENTIGLEKVSKRMSEAAEERFPEVVLEIESDLLKTPV